MFNVKEFTSIKDAHQHILNILQEIDTPPSMEFQIIHAITDTECSEEGGKLEDTGEILLDFLRDLDAQQGYMYYDKSDYWDFVSDPDEPGHRLYKPRDQDEVFVFAGEGVAVINNTFAVCESQYPIIVVKNTFWRTTSERILELLKYCDAEDDYTSKMSPAVFIELFYQ